MQFSKKVLLTGYLVIQFVGLTLGCLTIGLSFETPNVASGKAIFLPVFMMGFILSCIPTLIYAVAIEGMIYFSKKNGIPDIVICLQSILLTLVICILVVFADNYNAEGIFCIGCSDLQSPPIIISIIAGFLGTCVMVYMKRSKSKSSRQRYVGQKY